ncbi:hypothetical protein ACQ4PT_006405 [Festuca glaucescens]
MHAKPPSSSTAGGGGDWLDLPWELLADIHGRLRFTDRLAFTAVFGDLFKPEAPWLVLPQNTACLNKTTFFSLVDRRATTVRAWPLRDNVLLGSSGGWLAMADKEGRMHLVNPVTGEQHELPASTILVGLNVMSFLAIRSEMGDRVYRKLVLSASARPSSYAAMLIVEWQSYSVQAFATADDPAWRLAPLRDDVVDAVHHRGRFYSLSRSGVVEAWNEKELTSEVVTSGLAGEGNTLLATTPDGRLMVVFWDVVPFYWDGDLPRPPRYTFNVQVLDEASGSWQETDEIGQTAVLVGAENNIMCVSTTRELRLDYGQNLRGNCVYFTDEVKRQVCVYNLRHRTQRTIEELGFTERCTALWKAAAWFTPSFP